MLANRVSYFFHLHGESVTLDTACSSGLIAISMGIRSILTGLRFILCAVTYKFLSYHILVSSVKLAAVDRICLEAHLLVAGHCVMALCGGVNVILSPNPFISLSKAGMASERGQSHTFSELADGYARSEGCGVVLLKSLQQVSLVNIILSFPFFDSRVGNIRITCSSTCSVLTDRFELYHFTFFSVIILFVTFFLQARSFI